MEKLEWYGYPNVKKCEDTFIRFEIIQERDRQTGGQTGTARRQRPRLRIASPGNTSSTGTQ